MKTMYIFDFDYTLFFSPTEDIGKSHYKLITGCDWPYNGWWSKKESLDVDIFNIPRNEYTYNKYLEACNDNNGSKILVTGRLNKVDGMRENIIKLLYRENYIFDEVLVMQKFNNKPENGKNGVYLSDGSTYEFKIKLFDKIIEILDYDRIVIYDDRHEHIVKFYKWASTKKIEILIVNVVNKKIKIFNK